MSLFKPSLESTLYFDKLENVRNILSILFYLLLRVDAQSSGTALNTFRVHATLLILLSLWRLQLDSPSHVVSNLGPEALENLKEELNNTKVLPGFLSHCCTNERCVTR